LVFAVWAIVSVVRHPPFAWWVLVIALLGLLVIALVLHAAQLAKANDELRKRPEEVEKAWSERLRRELKEVAETKQDGRIAERRDQRNQLQALIDTADELLRGGHTAFRSNTELMAWSNWVDRMDAWHGEVIEWLQANADAPELAEFVAPYPLPRVWRDSQDAPYQAKTQELVWRRDVLRSVLQERFPPIS
jgi:hypothetical protein